jgi:hypothetical protein
MDAPRNALARKDYSACAITIRSLWRFRHFSLPRTRKDIRDEIRWFIMCAKRAKQVLRSTAS